MLTQRAFTWSIFAAFLLLLPTSAALFAQPDTQPEPDARALFHTHCAMCHGEHGEGVSALVSIAGPSLKAEHNPGMAMLAMQAGRPGMPVFAYVLSVPQMRALASYVTQQLADIPLSGGNVSNGGVLFRVNCAPCHRTAARGGGMVFVGTNAPDLTDKTPAIIAGAIRWGPGPMPAFPESLLDNRQLASIVDYVSYVQHPPHPGGNALRWYGPIPEGFVAWIIVAALIGATIWIEKGGKG